MKKELEETIEAYFEARIIIQDWQKRGNPMDRAISEIISLIEKEIDSIKDKIANYLSPLVCYKAQDIINIIKGKLKG